jgi:hypothetical protein
MVFHHQQLFTWLILATKLYAAKHNSPNKIYLFFQMEKHFKTIEWFLMHKMFLKIFHY